MMKHARPIGEVVIIDQLLTKQMAEEVIKRVFIFFMILEISRNRSQKPLVLFTFTQTSKPSCKIVYAFFSVYVTLSELNENYA